MSRRPGLALGLYRALSPVAAAAVRLVAPLSPKLGRGVSGRRHALGRLLAAADGVAGCLWFHASSVGEYEQARPVIQGLREQGLGPIAVTHFSPSGVDYAREHPCGDLHDYLPLDTPTAMDALVAAWRPRCLVCVKYDGWPNQILACDRAGVPVILVSASLPPTSGRLLPAARPFFRDVHDRFAAIGTGSEADRRRFVDVLGVRAPVTVTGDTRAEQVIRRFDETADHPAAAALAGWGDRRLVLGSTWPPDEERWLPVLGYLLSAHPGLRIVLAPHEPTPDCLARLAAALAGAGVPHRTLAHALDDGPGDARCVVVDRVGVLAALYHVADLAYVGGAFTTGVHSTLEPAVAGVPVLFGPRHHNAEEALELVACGGGRVVETAADAARHAADLLADDDARTTAGRAARSVVDARVGAAERSVRLVLDAMGIQR